MVPTTRDFSVKFGRTPDMGLEGQKAFPFVYSFVNYEFEDDARYAHIGPLIQPLTLITHNVMMDPDYNFKLLAVKYSVYHHDIRYPDLWIENPVSTEMTDPDTLMTGTPLLRYLGITLSIQGSSSNTLYGGDWISINVPVSAVNGRLPLRADVIEGYDYGFFTLRTPYLVPRQGILAFDLKNYHATKAMRVAAAIYGMKIRI